MGDFVVGQSLWETRAVSRGISCRCWMLWRQCAVAAMILGLSGPLNVARARADEARLTVRDDAGRVVQLARPATRVITMLPSLTEIVCALDLCDRLVATDRYSNFPAVVTHLPKTGGIDDASIELIVRMKPDVVVLNRSQRIEQRLTSLGVASVALKTDDFADIARSITVIGTLLGVPERASMLNAKINADVAMIATQARRARAHRQPSVYFEVDQAPYAAGPESFIGQMLTQLGLVNIAPAGHGAFPKLNPEYVVRMNPDIIFVSATEAQELAHRPGWAAIRAVREHRICSFPRQLGDPVMRAGPRIATGMQMIDACVRKVLP